MSQNEEHITLKWGTLKGWCVKSDEGKALLKRYFDLGASSGAMTQNDTPEQKEIICKLIDLTSSEEIFLDWDGKYVSKDAAKDYVNNYGKKKD